MERTLGWIRHDMDQKENGTKQTAVKPTPGKAKPLPKSQPKSRRRSDSLPRKQSRKPSQSQIEDHSQATPKATNQILPSAVAQTTVVTQAPAGELVSATDADAPNKGYYPEQPIAAQQNYQAMAYTAAQPQSMSSAGYSAGASMLYNNPAANVAPMAESPVSENPLVAFASQATQHMPPNNEAMYIWNGRGNTWQDWTAAIADTNDRYSADALLTLGGGAMHHQGDQPMDSSFIIGQGNSLGQQGGGMHQAAQPGQTWPIMMFDNNNSATSG